MQLPEHVTLCEQCGMVPTDDLTIPKWVFMEVGDCTCNDEPSISRRTPDQIADQWEDLGKEAQERRVRGYTLRYADVLCDQGDRNDGSEVFQDVVERFELRQIRIDAFLVELSEAGKGDSPKFTPEELAQIVTDGANIAHERLQMMFEDVARSNGVGNEQVETFILVPNCMKTKEVQA